MASDRTETRPREAWVVSRWVRLNGPGRLPGIDLARGLAIIGMFAAHLIWIEPFSWTDSATWVDVVNGRSSILFATLAGVSIAIVTGGTRAVTGPALGVARIHLAVRAGLLWVVGICLIALAVPVYVILPAYAVLFLLAIPMVTLTARVLLALAGALAVIMPFVQVILDALVTEAGQLGSELALLVGWHYPFTTWIAFLLAGVGIGRLDLRSARVPAVLVASGATLALVGYGLAAAAGDGDPQTFWGAVWTADAHSSGVLEIVGSGGFAIGVIGLCLLICRTPLTWLLLPLRAVGSMPLTAYAGQIVAWAVLQRPPDAGGSNLSAFRALEPFWPFALTTLILCTAWALLVGRGPLEWAIDCVLRAVDAIRRAAAAVEISPRP